MIKCRYCGTTENLVKERETKVFDDGLKFEIEFTEQCCYECKKFTH